MNKDNVKKWVEALRSGEYKQAQGVLYDLAGKYCCLGVACEVAGVDRNGPLFGMERVENFLPIEAIEWLGIDQDQDNPMIGPHSASCWNDLKGKTFPEIADLIEKYWLDIDSTVKAE